MKKWMVALSLVAGALAMNVTACSDEDNGAGQSNTGGGHMSPFPDCNEIAQTCHEVDVGEGEIHDCHEIGHDAKSEAECTPVKEHCLAICRAAAADAGAEGDGGEHDGG